MMRLFKRLSFLIASLFLSVSLFAQVPNFATSLVNNDIYAYTSIKKIIDSKELVTYTTLQFKIANGFSTGMDLSTAGVNSNFGLTLRYGHIFSDYFKAGVQVTPSFSLNDNFNWRYLTNALYFNGAITKDNAFRYTSNTWYTINKKGENTIDQWLYLSYTWNVGRDRSITVMPGIVYSWKFNQDIAPTVGVYYSFNKFSIYAWSGNLLKKERQFTIGIDFCIASDKN